MLMQHFRCLASLAKTTLSDLGKAYDVTPEGFGDALSLTVAFKSMRLSRCLASWAAGVITPNRSTLSRS
jgi:hypothetical protein